LLLLHEHLEQDIRIDAPSTHASSHTATHSAAAVVVVAVAVVVTMARVGIVQILQLHALVVSADDLVWNAVSGECVVDY